MTIISTLSTLQKSLSNRHRIADQERQLQKAQQELVTGVKTDIYTDRSFRAAQTLDLRNRMDRVETFAVSNRLLAGKMNIMSEVMSSIRTEVHGFMSTVTAYSGGGQGREVLHSQAQSMLGTLSTQINTVYAGEYLFSGENATARSLQIPQGGFDTGVTSIDPDLTQVRADIASIDAYFGLNAGAAPAGQASPFEADAYPSGSQNKFRARTDEHTTLSYGATTGDESIRQIMKGITMLAQTDVSKFSSSEAVDAWVKEAIGAMNAGISEMQRREIELGNQQSQLDAQILRQESLRTIYNNRIDDIEGIDDYEAATRFEALSAQLETSYAVTVRLKNLSLLNYL